MVYRIWSKDWKKDLWSLKFYYTSILDNLRIYGEYTTIYENNNRNYLKDKPDKVNGIFFSFFFFFFFFFSSRNFFLFYFQVEMVFYQLILRSISNINSLILYPVNSSENHENILMLKFILNNIYELIDFVENFI